MISRELNSVTTRLNQSRRWGLILCCAAVLGLVPWSFHAESRLETTARIENSEAQRVAEELARQFHSPFVNRAILVVDGLPSPDSEPGRHALREIADSVRAQPGVSGVLSYVDWPDRLFLGRGEGTFLIIGLAPATSSVETLVADLRQRVTSLAKQFQSRYPMAKLELTGETPLNFDLRKASSDEVRAAEIRAIPATLFLLLVAFGSLVAALIPLTSGQLAIGITIGMAALLAHRFHLSILVQSVATMLGLGLGIDYALLMVSRFREALLEGLSPGQASDIATREAGHTVLISASTVAIGFAVLVTVPISEIRSIGIAGFLVAGASASVAITLVPPILGVLGTRINAGVVPILGRFTSHSPLAQQRWLQWGRRIISHPWLALLTAGAPLLFLASQALRLDTSLPRGDWLPPAAESVRALRSLERIELAGIVQSLRVILELPPGSGVQTQQGWNAATRVSKKLALDPRASRVVSLPTLTEYFPKPYAVDMLPQATRNSFLRNDQRATLFEVLPDHGVNPTAQIQWVRELRRARPEDLSGVAGSEIRIGGIPALNADYQSVVGNRLPAVMALVLGGTLLALLIGFRSLFAGLKAVALNLLSVGAAFGALVLVFQDGHGSALFGLPEGTGGVFPIVPILAFAIVFGLSMDYEVFLIARVLEMRRSGQSDTDAIAWGLARTGGVITSAAAIMVVVFGAFTLGGFLVIKMLGFTLAVAVLIDATLVRMVIGPALLVIAGDWNWWPWGLSGSSVTRRQEGTS